MLNPTLLVLLASVGHIEGRYILDRGHMESHTETRRMHGLMALRSVREPSKPIHAFPDQRQNENATGTTLLANAIQTGSFSDGSINGVQRPGQSASKTSKNNFINLCAGKSLTNGLQVVAGSCNGIPMGDIPAKANMISSMITFPEAGDTSIEADTTFKISVQTSNLVAGSFTNATSTYYAGPQFLQEGKVVGHTHVTVQDMGNSLNPAQPLDPTQFVFFKGINDVGNGNGLLSATVTGGLSAGNYRVCTMTSASNHQPVLMPVAQRGTTDDCTKFTITAGETIGAITAGDNTGDDGGSAASNSEDASSSTESTKNRKGGNHGKAKANTFLATAPFQNTTVAMPSSQSSAPASLSTGAALGGIAAPEITDSGDDACESEV